VIFGLLPLCILLAINITLFLLTITTILRGLTPCAINLMLPAPLSSFMLLFYTNFIFPYNPFNVIMVANLSTMSCVNSFLARGTTYHLSCPYTSSQNGKAERVIRTTNDIMHTLLLQAHMSLQYWVVALHTSTYLLNR
jgi:hypothetical protein